MLNIYKLDNLVDIQLFINVIVITGLIMDEATELRNYSDYLYDYWDSISNCNTGIVSILDLLNMTTIGMWLNRIFYR